MSMTEGHLLKRVSPVLTLLTVLSACSSPPSAIAQDCPSDLPQAITVNLMNANGGQTQPQSGDLTGTHKFLLSRIEPTGAVTLRYGQKGGVLHSVDLSLGQPVTVGGDYMELAVFDPQTRPERHRATLCTDGQNTWHVQ
jgi:hypothetical protein